METQWKKYKSSIAAKTLFMCYLCMPHMGQISVLLCMRGRAGARVCERESVLDPELLSTSAFFLHWHTMVQLF